MTPHPPKRHDDAIRKCLRSQVAALIGQVQPVRYGSLFLTRHFS
ncbi:hypothetical protein [Rubripirellula lacrimiformis]|nr:hypothetical protein [Rubripirellula lacrimiformis]